MSLHNYIEKLRAKPVRERERIAVIATAVGFVLILVIWVISFKEMNKQAEPQADQTSASLNDLKTNFQTGKDSIQNMMQQLPSQTGTDNSTGNVPSAPSVDSNQNIDNNPNAGNNLGVDGNSNPATNSINTDQKNNSVPQLP